MKIKIRQPRKQSISLPESYYQIPDNGTMFFNQSGEEIPPFGVFQGHDTNNTAENFPPIVIAKKPIDAAANASAIFVNGPNAVENNGFGYAQPGPIYKVLHDGTAAAGDDLGLTDDSFEASPGSGPFVAIGEDDVAENVFLCLLAAGSSGRIKYCVLAEDANSCPVLAYRATMDDTGAIVANDPAETFDLYFHSELLSAPKVARRGYPCMYSIDDEGRDSFIGNPCINSCDTEASIDASSLPDGEVGTAYTGTVAVSGLDAEGVTATGLPAGLSLNPTTGAITGTPTTAGTYEVLFQGEDEFGCDLSVIEVIVIFADGEGPEPPVEDP